MNLAQELEEAVGEGTYEVAWVTYVDHPEKRDSSYKVRTKSFTDSNSSTNYARFKERARAISYAKALLGGDEDFASEFTRSVSINQYLANGKKRWVMRPVDRQRGEDGKIKLMEPPA